ncbi:MAG: ABC transporter substrate-binding protein [Caulobacteraceae bacterium]|nr:ABC transporter substrate-binding protein [Caulobacteraceae bacterium]
MDLDRRLLIAGGAVAVAAAASATAAVGRVGKAAVVAPVVVSASPQRIVSLNPCLDVILIQLVDHSRIAALSHYSREAYGSTIAPVARTLPFTYGTAEEIIAREPDLVITGRFSAATGRALDRLGVRTVVFDVPETVEASLAQVREVARLAGAPERGEAMVARIEAALTEAAPKPGTPRLSTLVFMPGGFASGPGTLMDEMMRRMGLDNAATKYGLRQSMSVPLEQVIADPPDLLLSGEVSPGAPSRALRVMSHPALRHVAGHMSHATFPEKLLFCGGPVLIQTAAALAQARESALKGRG